MSTMAVDGGERLLAAAIRAAVQAGTARRTVQAVDVGVAGVIWHPRTPAAAPVLGPAPQEAGAADGGPDRPLRSAPKAQTGKKAR